ncbi:MAG: hypothetical protein GXP43_02070 [bacterium]|nr:hypothetical protein [bacterium]
MLDPRKIGIISTTQDRVPIKDVQDDLVILKDNACAVILQVGAINFDLLSEEEQEAVIYSYSALLNSLSFPIQIYIRSQKKDISGYLNFLTSQINAQKNSVLKQRLIGYKNFVQKLVKEKNVLDKKFYLVIPYHYVGLASLNKTFSFNLFTKDKKPPTKPHGTLPKEIIEKAKTNLFPKRDHLIRQLARIGLPTRQLTTTEIIHLFHSVYNPEQPLKPAPASDYAATIVTARPQPIT